jgi:hypothetical protein
MLDGWILFFNFFEKKYYSNFFIFRNLQGCFAHSLMRSSWGTMWNQFENKIEISSKKT